MLFSNQPIADYINENFEAAWESVRPVPKVTIDFGNGTVVNRTLHGNVATYICDHEATVLDVLPGVYEPEAYLQQLRELVLVAKYVQAENEQENIGMDMGMGAGIGGGRQEGEKTDTDEARLSEYHRKRAAAIESGKAFEVTEVSRGVSIRGAELGTEIVMNTYARLAARGMKADWNMGRRNVSLRSQEIDGVKTSAADSSPAKMALKHNLAADTQINEGQRRLQIHRHLLKSGLKTPETMKAWLYREVLHADLDDSYLGLKHVLFDNYPFDDK